MAAASGSGAKREQLLSEGIVPDVLSEIPEVLLDLRGYFKEIELVNGVLMRVNETQMRPHVELRGPSFGGAEDFYTLVVVDPDAPKPEAPTNRSFLHWLVTNIPGSIAPSEEVWEEGDEVVEWYGPAPPHGVHRYVFALFKQDGKLNLKDISRFKFNVVSFAKDQKLGQAVAALYFRAAHKDVLEYPARQS